MKILTRTVIIALLAAQGLAPALAAGPRGGPARPGQSRPPVAIPAVGAAEAATLGWMREEEKLARDVYRGLAERWPDIAFKNIANSEQRHFDALGAKITQFALADPALADVGLFANDELQALYNNLVADGAQSYERALVVGATIEEVDIRDLLDALDATTNSSLRTTYQNLLAGSKNHLRLFVSRLQALGHDYTPQHIDPVLFDAIVGN